MKEIELTRGFVTKVDNEDFEWLNQWNWYVNTPPNHYSSYVHRQVRDPILKNKRGYAKQVLILMHRQIMNVPKGQHVDHIDGDGLNNQRINLRTCSHPENLWNQRKRTNNYSSIYKGVTRNKNKWSVVLMVNGVWHNLGVFACEKAAAKEYDKLAKLVFGEFALLNFPDE